MGQLGARIFTKVQRLALERRNTAGIVQEDHRSGAAGQASWCGTDINLFVERIPENLLTHADLHTVYQENMFFAGKMKTITRFLGLDYGPFVMEGSKETVIDRLEFC